MEIAQLQVGKDASKSVNLIVSTLAEAEYLLPMLKEHRNQGRKVNVSFTHKTDTHTHIHTHVHTHVHIHTRTHTHTHCAFAIEMCSSKNIVKNEQVLYGLPIPKSAMSRLAAIAQSLGEGSLSVLLDDPSQIPIVSNFHALSGVVPHAHIKVDMGGRRAGVEVQSDRFLELADAALEAHRQGSIILSGLYSHAGHSYGGNSRAAAIKMMHAELTAMLEGADRLKSRASDKVVANLPALVVSAGASPTSLSVQNLVAAEEEEGHDTVDEELRIEVKTLSELFARVREKGYSVEIHAGVYPILDLQQLAAHSVQASRMSWDDIALTILAEVHSNYPGRGIHGSDEALIGAGSLALGRETCKAYEGMAMLKPWNNRLGGAQPTCDVEDFRGWIISRFSQEHGILTWRSGNSQVDFTPPDEEMAKVGEKVRLWPNHACITSSHFGWYFVVDEDRRGKEDEVIDIWVKARGW